MAAKSFIQYDFCEVCKQNHQDGMKHVYTKRHRNRLIAITSKFAEKISEAKKFLSEPEIHSEDWEKNKKMWCYVCEKEIDKHVIEDEVTIVCYGIIEHLASVEHCKSAKRFWWQNKLDKNKLSKYLIHEEVFKKFVDRLPEVKKKYESDMDQLHKHHVQEIRNAEMDRQKIVENAHLELTVSDNVNLPGSSSSMQNKSLGNQSAGNIFTGAVPPWLWNDATNSKEEKTKNNVGYTSQSVIGPTMNEYIEFSNKEKKKHLNPKRVGANFDHNAKTSSAWLPSFGRVWNNGRRLQSRYQYRKEVLRRIKNKTKHPKT